MDIDRQTCSEAKQIFRLLLGAVCEIEWLPSGVLIKFRIRYSKPTDRANEITILVEDDFVPVRDGFLVGHSLKLMRGLTDRVIGSPCFSQTEHPLRAHHGRVLILPHSKVRLHVALPHAKYIDPDPLGKAFTGAKE